MDVPADGEIRRARRTEPRRQPETPNAAPKPAPPVTPAPAATPAPPPGMSESGEIRRVKRGAASPTPSSPATPASAAPRSEPPEPEDRTTASDHEESLEEIAAAIEADVSDDVSEDAAASRDAAQAQTILEAPPTAPKAPPPAAPKTPPPPKVQAPVPPRAEPPAAEDSDAADFRQAADFMSQAGDAADPSGVNVKPATVSIPRSELSAVESGPESASESGSSGGTGDTSAELGGPPTKPEMNTGAVNQSGRRFGDFLLEKKIGQGGMGEVYRARQVSLDRPVAVKCLSRGLATQPGFVERFQREAKAAANIVHPHVIQIYAYGIDQGTPYFAMEYVEGEDLQQRMRRLKRLALEEIVDTMIAVASALAAAHEKGMIHRDIKPSNVMIDKQGNVKVMDFGLAKAATTDGSLTSSGVIMGTPNYLSPEQGRGDPIDGRADLYSLGVVLYELLAGDLPFRADTPAGLIFKHVYEEPVSLLKRNKEVPPFLDEVTLKLLAKDPAERYPDAKALLNDLRDFMDNQDHYMAGGKRRSALETIDDRAGIKAPPEKGSDALTEAMERPDLEAPLVESDPAVVAATAPATPSATQVIVREQGSNAPLWIILILLIAGFTGFTLWKSGKLAEWGLVEPEKPPAPVAIKLTAAEIGFPGITARLAGTAADKNLHPDEESAFPVGQYRLTVQRPGYKAIDTDLKVVSDGGKGRLVRLDGAPFTFEYVASDQLRKAYEDGKASLDRGRPTLDDAELGKAKVSFEQAKEYDPSYRPQAGDKTVAELLDETVKLQGAGEIAYKEAGTLKEARSWRKLRDVTKPNAASKNWATLLEVAETNIANGDQLIRDAEAARGKGDFAGALDVLGRVEKDDPGNPATADARAKVAALSDKREKALALASAATTPAEVTTAKDALEAYVKDVPGDLAAKGRVESLAERLKNDLAAPLQEAIKAQDWTRADELWKTLSATQPGNPNLAGWRGTIDEGKRVEAVRGAVTVLDRALAGSAEAPQALLDLLDLSSPGMTEEKQAVGELGEAGAKILSSKHQVESVEVKVSSDGAHVATVVATWSVELEVAGEKVSYTQKQKIGLRSQNGSWRFTRFAAEGQGKQ
jgi:serine/threonine protein kinase